MKTILRNFYSTVRRFRITGILNVAGLSVAFLVFLILMMQVGYELGFDRFHEHADRLYRLEVTHGENGAQAVLSRPLSEAFVASSAHIEKCALLNGFVQKQYITVEREGKRETFQEMIYPVTADYPELFELTMVEGERTALKREGEVLIPERMARKFFGMQNALGQKLICEGWTAVVGGVYRDLPGNSIVTNSIYRKISDKYGVGNWNQNNFECYIRLDNPASAEGLTEQFKQHFQHEELDWKTMDLRLVPLHDVYFQTDSNFDTQKQKGSYAQMRVLIGIALLIIVIAAINFANFSNAQVPMRLRSINTQKVLGGSVGMIRLSLMVEAVVMSLLAYLLALGMLYFLSGTSFADVVVGGLSMEGRSSLIIGVGAFALTIGLVSGSWPAWYITSFPPALVLKGNFGLSPKGKALRNGLVCVQFVVSFILITGALFVDKQNSEMLRIPLGFDREQILVMNLNKKLQAEPELVRQRLKGNVDIEAVSFTSGIIGSSDNYTQMGRTYEGNTILFLAVQTDFSILDVLGIAPTEGRVFLPEDELSDGAFLFNEQARKQFGLRPGGIIALDWGDWHLREQVAGFIPDIKYNSFRSVTEPFAFFMGKNATVGSLSQAMIRTRAGADYPALKESVAQTLREIDPDFASDLIFFDEIQANLYQNELRVGRQITFFSIAAVLISLIGVLGVVIFECEYRRKEVGIRKIFGSTVAELLCRFNLAYLKIMAGCFIVSVPVVYYGVIHWQESFTYKIPLSWWMFILAFLLVTVITLLTVSVQSWHVANANPVDSIKNE